MLELSTADAVVAGIEVDGVPIIGFDPAVTACRVAVGRPDCAATASDPFAAVAANRQGSRRLTTSASEDGGHTHLPTHPSPLILAGGAELRCRDD